MAWCEGPDREFSALDETRLTGWGHDTRRYVAPEIAGLDRAELGRLELKWAFGYPTSTRALTADYRDGRRVCR